MADTIQISVEVARWIASEGWSYFFANEVSFPAAERWGEIGKELDRLIEEAQ